jgi:hypothetical protein
VKNSILNKSLFAALLIASPIVGAESKYPAADFEPGVVYKDNELIEKHNQAAKQAPVVKAQTKAEPVVTKSNNSSAETSYTESKTAKSSAASSGEPTIGTMPIALAVLAIGGFAFWRSKSVPKVAPAQAPAAVANVTGTSGATGVEKYLNSRPEVAGTAQTGVAKYLSGIAAETPSVGGETGVSKYLKKLPESAVSNAETGVSKYLKNIT